MKNKRIIKFISALLATVILFSSLSVSVFAEEITDSDEDYVENNGDGYSESYDEGYYEGEAMNCAPPIWVIPIIIAVAPLAFVFDMFTSFINGDFSILNEIPRLFTSMWTSVFG